MQSLKKTISNLRAANKIADEQDAFKLKSVIDELDIAGIEYTFDDNVITLDRPYGLGTEIKLSDITGRYAVYTGKRNNTGRSHNFDELITFIARLYA